MTERLVHRAPSWRGQEKCSPAKRVDARPWRRGRGGTTWYVLAQLLVFDLTIVTDGGVVTNGLLLAQEHQPELTCDTRATVPAGSRTPALRFMGVLAPDDTLKFVVIWMPDTTSRPLQLVRARAVAESLRVECSSRRRLDLRLNGAWRRDSVVVQVMGVTELELVSEGTTLSLRLPASEAGTRDPRLTICVLATVRGRTRFECRSLTEGFS